MKAFDSLVLVVRDLVDITDNNITSFCDVAVYQNGEYLDSESGSWMHLNNIGFVDKFFL